MNKVALMNVARTLKNKRNECNGIKRHISLLKRSLDMPEGTDSKQTANGEDTKEEKDINSTILYDLLKHNVDKNDSYTNETMNLSLQLHSLSPKTYALLELFLNFPPIKTLEKEIEKGLLDLPEKITNVDYVNDVVDIWKEKRNIPPSKKIAACLAVDAVFFKPEVKISVDKCVKGILLTSSEVAETAKIENYQDMKLFLQKHWQSVIKSGFVFQVQPYLLQYKPFVVHIKPASNGKASEDIVNLLHQIRAKLKNRRIVIKSYAFDGDGAYRKLHVAFFNSYISGVLLRNGITTKNSTVIRVISDYSHVSKRLRYRVLSCIVHAGFDIDSDFIDLESIKKILSDVGDVVWNNESFTKMHDSLPNELFKSSNLLKLMRKKSFVAAGYWFPISSSMIALTKPSIGFRYREFLLQCSFYFLVYYYQSWKENSFFSNLKQRKRGDDKDVVFYTEELLIEFTNTLYAHLQLLSIDGYSFTRNSTTPLEHKFGYARVRSNNVDTLARFISVISRDQTIDSKSTFKEIQDELRRIRGRLCHIEMTVEPKSRDERINAIDENEVFDLPYTPQTVAKVFLQEAGFPLKGEGIDGSEILMWYDYFLEELEGLKPTIRKMKSMTLNKLTYNTNRSQKNKGLIMAVPPKIITLQKERKNICKRMLKDIFVKRYGLQKPKKEHLVDMFETIKEADEDAPNLPNPKARKNVLMNWLVENIHIYQNLF